MIYIVTMMSTTTSLSTAYRLPTPVTSTLAHSSLTLNQFFKRPHFPLRFDPTSIAWLLFSETTSSDTWPPHIFLHSYPPLPFMPHYLANHSSRILLPHPHHPTGSQNLGLGCSAASFYLCKPHCRAKDDSKFSASYLPSLVTSSFATSFALIITLAVFRFLSFLFLTYFICLLSPPLSSFRANEVCLPELCNVT